jgi:hypothetical protein
MSIETLTAELESIELWDAEYRLQVMRHFESTHAYMARQARRVEIMELIRTNLTPVTYGTAEA